jgi:hypothetical protein
MAPTIAPKATPASAAPVAHQPRRMFVFGAGFVGRYVSERSSRKAGRFRSALPPTPSPPFYRSAPFRRDGGGVRCKSSLLPLDPRLVWFLIWVGLYAFAGRSRGRAPVLPRRGSSRRWACALPSSMQQIASMYSWWCSCCSLLLSPAYCSSWSLAMRKLVQCDVLLAVAKMFMGHLPET